MENEKIKFTYCIVPEAQFNQMMSIETELDNKAAEQYGYSSKFEDEYICDEKIEYVPSWESLVGSWSGFPDIIHNHEDNRLKRAFSTTELDIGKTYKLTCFPKTCSFGFAFVNTE